MSQLTANGKPTTAQLPCTVEQFIVAQNLLPRRVKAALAAGGAAA